MVDDLDIGGGEGRLPRVDQGLGIDRPVKGDLEVCGFGNDPIDRQGPALEGCRRGGPTPPSISSVQLPTALEVGLGWPGIGHA